MKLIKLLIFGFLFLFSAAHAAYGQKKEITEMMQAISQGETYTGSQDKIYETENASKVLDILHVYFTDTLPAVRKQAFNIVAGIGKKSSDKEIRVKVVKILAQACLYTDAETVSAAIKPLRFFEKDEFDQASIDAILKALYSNPPYFDDFVLLAGYLESSQSTSYLKNCISDGKIQKTDKWKTYVAMARMGDSESIAYVCSKLKNMPEINDDIVYDLVPDLIFTRSHEVYNFVIEMLFSDKKNCYPANPEKTSKILCAYRIMEYLAPVIIDYPYELSAGGDIETSDYDKALKEIRLWFTQNPSYKIDKSAY
jgi:hypothetical protein